jgi:hypothetical protein
MVAHRLEALHLVCFVELNLRSRPEACKPVLTVITRPTILSIYDARLDAVNMRTDTIDENLGKQEQYSQLRRSHCSMVLSFKILH